MKKLIIIAASVLAAAAAVATLIIILLLSSKNTEEKYLYCAECKDECEYSCNSNCVNENGICMCNLSFWDSQRISVFDIGEINFDSHKAPENIDNSTRFYSYDDLYSVYVVIAKNLIKKDRLSKAEIIETADFYKKLLFSLENYEASDSSSKTAELPEMQELYDDMQKDVIELLYNNNIIRFPKHTDKNSAGFFIENLLIYTEGSLSELKIIKKSEDTLYVLSDDGQLFFSEKISDSEGITGYTEFYPNTDESYLKYSDQAISVMDLETPIPLYKKN